MLISLELPVRLDQANMGVGRVFEFDNGERKTIHKYDEIRPSPVASFGDRQLANDKPFVVLRLVEVQGLRESSRTDPSLISRSTGMPSTSIS